MAIRLDQSLGEVVAALDLHGFSENTLVVFASDPGAMAPGEQRNLLEYRVAGARAEAVRLRERLEQREAETPAAHAARSIRTAPR